MYYIDDPLENRWFVVLSTETRNMRKNDDLVEVNVLDKLNTIGKILENIDGFDTLEATVGSYSRDDIDGIWIDIGRSKTT